MNVKKNQINNVIFMAIALAGLIACGEAEHTNFDNDSTGITKVNTVPGKNNILIENMPDSTAAMQAWRLFRTPGDMHLMMTRDDGNWKEQITMWASPGIPPQTMAASCIKSMILGGRYQQSVHTGMVKGMPFEGRSMLGYDNGRKKFVKSWVDNRGTGITNMEGDYDAANRIIHLKGTQTNPVTGKAMDVREDYIFNPDGSRLLERYGSQMAGSPEYKILEIKLMKR